MFGIFAAEAQTHIYKHYNTADGLPSSIVYGIFQDSKDYMWFATDYGASRFDGIKFTNYVSDSSELSNYVMAVTESNQGAIILASCLEKKISN